MTSRIEFWPAGAGPALGGPAPAQQALLSVIGVLDVDLAETALLPRGPADLVVQPR